MSCHHALKFAAPCTLQTHYTTLVKVKEAFDQGIPPEDRGGAQGHAARQLYVLGQYVRDGIGQLHTPTAEDILSLALQFLHHPHGASKRCVRADVNRRTVGIRVQESALQAAGMVLVAQPRLTMTAPVRKAMRVVMAPSAPPKLKSRALANIADMLRVGGGGFSTNNRQHAQAESARMTNNQRRKGAAGVAVVNNADDASFAGAAVQVRLLHTDTRVVQPSAHHPGAVGPCAATRPRLQRTGRKQAPQQPGQRRRALQGSGRHRPRPRVRLPMPFTCHFMLCLSRNRDSLIYVTSILHLNVAPSIAGTGWLPHGPPCPRSSPSPPTRSPSWVPWPCACCAARKPRPRSSWTSASGRASPWHSSSSLPLPRPFQAASRVCFPAHARGGSQR